MSSMNYFQRLIYNLKILPRWVIIFMDVVFIGFSAMLGYFLRFSFSVPDILHNNFFEGVALQTLFGLTAILLTNSYRGIIRYTGLQDGVRIFYMLVLNAVLVAAF